MEDKLPKYSMSPFEVLGISKEDVMSLKPNQLNQLVKGYYKALQRVYHPDVGGDEKKAAEINAAYEFLVSSADNFETARETYLREGVALKQTWLQEISILEETVRKQEAEIKRISEKADAAAKAQDKKIDALTDALYSNLGFKDAPAGAVKPKQYQNYIYLININMSEFINSETFCQILKDGSYHHLNSPRAKILPTTHWMFSGAVKNSLSEKAMQMLQKNSTSVRAEDMPLFAVALRPYILKDNYIVIKDMELTKFMFVHVNEIIPKKEFNNKKFRVL